MVQIDLGPNKEGSQGRQQVIVRLSTHDYARLRRESKVGQARWTFLVVVVVVVVRAAAACSALRPPLSGPGNDVTSLCLLPIKRAPRKYAHITFSSTEIGGHACVKAADRQPGSCPGGRVTWSVWGWSGCETFHAEMQNFRRRSSLSSPSRRLLARPPPLRLGYWPVSGVVQYGTLQYALSLRRPWVSIRNLVRNLILLLGRPGRERSLDTVCRHFLTRFIGNIDL